MKIKNTYFFWVLLVLSLLFGCKTNTQTAYPNPSFNNTTDSSIRVGASRMELYLPLLKDKKVALVANPTSVLPNATLKKRTHLSDTLLALGVKVKKVFSPEHGFRGKASAGEKVFDGIDPATGLPVISLYGVHKKPTPEQLREIDILLFDLQDVGVRFYTYLSTLHYIMEAAAEQQLPLIVLDRPNPNGHYIDGPILEDKHRSFVGLHPVPVVYGMSIGEYARMINGEGWLRNGIACDLTVIPIKNYVHNTPYKLPVKPSPNLPNSTSVNLYPSLCFFEGTVISCGRGTDFQFQIFGAPELSKKNYLFTFIPKPNAGAKYPKHQDKKCYGKDLRNEKYQREIQLKWLLEAYKNYPNKDTFFNSFFSKLAGTEHLQNQIELGYSQEDIKRTWESGLKKFKQIRSKYLLYE